MYLKRTFLGRFPHHIIMQLNGDSLSIEYITSFLPNIKSSLQSVSCSVMSVCDPMDCDLCPWNFPHKNTTVGSHSFLQGISPTQVSILGLLYCRQILRHLSHQGSPKNAPRVSCHSLLQGIFLTQGLTLGLPHCRQIPYHLSHQGTPNIKIRVIYIFCTCEFANIKSD